MSYLVDTDRVAEYLKGREGAIALLAKIADEGIAISLITFGEIYEGIYHGRNPQAHEHGFREFLRSVQVLSLNRSIMRRFARIRGDLRAQGQIIADPDILIGATALYHDLTLVTNNVRHFQRIPDLKLYRED